MKKEISAFLLPICLVACSHESGVGQFAADTNATADAEALVEVPVFAFGEDGSRYNINLENGEKTKIEMNRSKLVISDENEFESLKEKYRRGLSEAKEMAYPVNYYCKAELLAINTDYSEVVTSDGKVLLDDASLLEGCVDVSKEEPLTKTTSYTNYPNSRTVNMVLDETNTLPRKIYVESDIIRNAGLWEGRGVTAVYAYSEVNGQGIYVPYAPVYAAMHMAMFKKARCYDNANEVFECKDRPDNVEESEDCWYKYMGGSGSCPLFDHGKKYGKYQNATYSSWSLQNDVGANFEWGVASDYGVISLHAVVLAKYNPLYQGRETFYIRTGMNVDKTLGDKFYNKYLSRVNLLEHY